MRILVVYFSATGNTSKMAKAIKEGFVDLGAEADEYDITLPSARQNRIDLTPYQAVILGSPIHIQRAPKVVREWLRTLDGHGMKCSMFFTCGGFKVHPAHYSTRRILEEQGFVVVSSAEFLGAHTFNIGGWKAMEGRPDEDDFRAAKEYVVKTYKRFTGEVPQILGELEKTQYSDNELDQLEGRRFQILTQLPDRNGKDCSMCMMCEELCPTGAMDAETGKADKEKCIACLRCMANCPDNALQINDMSGIWSSKLEKDNVTEDDLKKKKSKIYM